MESSLDDTKVPDENKIITILSGDRKFTIDSKLLFNGYKEYDMKDTEEKIKRIICYPKHLQSFTEWNIDEISLPTEYYPTEYIEIYLKLITIRDEFDISGSILNKVEHIRSTFDAFNVSNNKHPVNFLTFLNRLGDSEMNILYAKYIAIRVCDPQTLPFDVYDLEESDDGSDDASEDANNKDSSDSNQNEDECKSKN